MSTSFSGSSESALLHTSLTWTITNYSFRDAFVKSPAFLDEKKNLFYLGLHPNENAFVRLDIIMAAKQPVNIKYKLSLISLHGQSRLLYDQTGTLVLFSQSPSLVGLSIPQFISRADLLEPSNGYLPVDTLTLHCEIVHLDNETNLSAIHSKRVNQADSMAKIIGTLLNDFGSLLKSGNLADVKLVVGGKTFLAHKLILSTRSSVFAAIFSHDPKGKMENQIEILDVTAEAMKKFLSFLYTGAKPTLESIMTAKELLIVADKYNVVQLKTICEDYLISKLTIGTAPTLLLLANSVDSPKVKESSLEFIRSRGSELFDALKNNPEQMINLFQILAEKGEPKGKEEKTTQTDQSESMNETEDEDTEKGKKRKLLED